MHTTQKNRQLAKHPLPITYYPLPTKGFTLVEAMVSVGIISILSVMLMRSFPFIRNSQHVKLTQEQLASQLRRAQQLALDETRAEACLNLFVGQEDQNSRCSDVGVALRGQKLIMFADTTPHEADNKYTDGDYVLSSVDVPGDVTMPEKSFLFKGTPPTMLVYVDGVIKPLKSAEPLTIGVGETQVLLNVYPYGYVEKQ